MLTQYRKIRGGMIRGRLVIDLYYIVVACTHVLLLVVA